MCLLCLARPVWFMTEFSLTVFSKSNCVHFDGGKSLASPNRTSSSPKHLPVQSLGSYPLCLFPGSLPLISRASFVTPAQLLLRILKKPLVFDFFRDVCGRLKCLRFLPSGFDIPPYDVPHFFFTSRSFWGFFPPPSPCRCLMYVSNQKLGLFLLTMLSFLSCHCSEFLLCWRDST